MISICISTYGDDKWAEMAERALDSTNGQVAEVVILHQPEGDIATARNAAAREATGEYLCFLDADDELDPSFIERMERTIAKTPGWHMFTPRVSYVAQGRTPQAPKYWPEVPLHQGNWLIIGTLVPRKWFIDIGGFESWPHAYEDWHMFAKLWKDGCDIVKVPNAIYIAHVTPKSRNKKLSRKEYVQWHYDLGRDLFPEHYPPEWLDRHMRNARGR